jgi:hypothetical protein
MGGVLSQDHLRDGHGRHADPVRAAGWLAVLERGGAAAGEQPTPFAHRAGVHTQAGGDLGRALARQRHQDGSGTIRLAALGRACQRSQGRVPFLIGGDLRPARHHDCSPWQK